MVLQELWFLGLMEEMGEFGFGFFGFFFGFVFYMYRESSYIYNLFYGNYYGLNNNV